MDNVFASYTPEEGRISYLAGVSANTNFQETLFNNNDTQSKLGRSQSFAVLLQALGDMSSKSSLMAEVHLGTHKFIKETLTYVDVYKFEAIAFDLGYRHSIGGNFWLSGQLGSLYPWRVTQSISSRPATFDDSEFSSIYSVALGIQYETKLKNRPVSYDFKIRKYMSTQLDDQASMGLSIGWRFGN